MIKKRGFTLVELLAVIAILMLLVVLVYPTIEKSFDDAVKNSLINQVKIFKKAAADGYSATIYGRVVPEDTTYTYVDGELEENSGNIKFDVSKFNLEQGIIKIRNDGKVAIALYDGEFCAIKKYDNDEITLDERESSECQIVDYTRNECFITEWNDLSEDLQDYLSGAYEDESDMGVDGKIIYAYDYENPDCGEDIIIPPVIDGENVEAIGHGAFKIQSAVGNNFSKSKTLVADSNNNYLSDLIAVISGPSYRPYLTSVSIPSTVKVIGRYAFNNNRITSVTFSEGLISIEENAFCENPIESLTLPNSLETIGVYAFSENSLVGTLIIPDNVTSIGDGAFSSTYISEVRIGSKISHIGYYAFETPVLEKIVINRPRNIVSSMTSYSDQWGATNATIRCSEDVEYDITNSNSNIQVSSTAYGGDIVKLISNVSNTVVSSFKMNGIPVTGSVFIMPQSDVEITDVVLVEGEVIESAHPYLNSYDYTWTKTINGASSVVASFDSLTYTEVGYDFIEIYDKNDNFIGSYDGSMLANQEIIVPGDTIKIRLITDYIVNKWGFKCFVYQQ